MPRKRTWMSEEQLDRIDYFAMETTVHPYALHQEMLQDTKPSEVPGLRLLGNRVREVRRWMYRDFVQEPWNPGQYSADSKYMFSARKAYLDKYGSMPPNLSKDAALNVIRVCMMFEDLSRELAFHIGLRYYYARRTQTYRTQALTDFLTLTPWVSHAHREKYDSYLQAQAITPFERWDNLLLVARLQPGYFKEVTAEMAVLPRRMKQKRETVTVQKVMQGWRLEDGKEKGSKVLVRG